MKFKKGFTLLEILLVIALIGILAGIIIVAINPTRQLAQARNFQRQGHIKTINDAVSQYIVKTGDTPEGVTGWYKDICPVGGGSNCVDLSVLIPDYLSEIPTEPDGTPYQIALNTTTNKLSLRSGEAELGADISTNPLPPVGTFAKSIGTENWQWGDAGRDIEILPNGDWVIVGEIVGDVVFGEGEVNETTLSTIGYRDVFVAKYNANNTLAWAKKVVESDSTEVGFSLDVYSDGSIIITGHFPNGVTFAPGEPNETARTCDNRTENCMYIIKYNPNGTMSWIKNSTSPFNSSGARAIGVTVLDNGESVVTGNYSGTNTFGQGESNQTTFIDSDINPSNNNIFVAKYNANGNLLWAKSVGNPDESGHSPSDIISFSDGSTIITGWFTDRVIFGEGEVNQTIFTAIDFDSDGFIAKYNPNGTLAWAKHLKGDDYLLESGNSLKKINDEIFVLTGGFEDNIILARGESNEINLQANGWANNSDIFIAQYNINGSLIWAKNTDGRRDASSSGVSSFIDGSIVVTGFIGRNTTIIGQGDINQTNLVCTVSTNWDTCAFIAKYNSDGTLAWARQYAAVEYAVGYSVDTYIDGSSIIIGNFDGNFVFPTKNGIPITLLDSGEGDDIFIAKLNPDGLLE